MFPNSSLAVWYQNEFITWGRIKLKLTRLPGRMFLNSSLAGWYHIGIIIYGRISLYLTRFLWQDDPKFILGRMIPKLGHWHGSNILPRVFGSHPANCRLYNTWQDIDWILFVWQDVPKFISGSMISKWVHYLRQDKTQTYSLTWQDVTKFILGRMIPNWDYYMWQDITLPYSFSLAGCCKIHPWQDDTKMWSLTWVQYPAKGFWEPSFQV